MSVPRKPRRSRDHRPPPPSGAGTALALIALLFIVAGLVVLVGVVLPQALWLVVVVFGFVFIGILHYLTWGRMMRNPYEDEEDDE